MDKAFSALAGMDNAKGFFYMLADHLGDANSYSAGRGQNSLALVHVARAWQKLL